MTNTLPIQEWLDVIRGEYLQGFVKDGGASIKFAVPTGEDLTPLLRNALVENRPAHSQLSGHGGPAVRDQPQRHYHQDRVRDDQGDLRRKVPQPHLQEGGGNAVRAHRDQCPRHVAQCCCLPRMSNRRAGGSRTAPTCDFESSPKTPS